MKGDWWGDRQGDKRVRDKRGWCQENTFLHLAVASTWFFSGMGVLPSNPLSVWFSVNPRHMCTWTKEGAGESMGNDFCLFHKYFWKVSVFLCITVKKTNKQTTNWRLSVFHNLFSHNFLASYPILYSNSKSDYLCNRYCEERSSSEQLKHMIRNQETNMSNTWNCTFLERRFCHWH